MSPDERDRDRDEPLAELRELEVEPRPGFLERVRHRVDRRVLGVHALRFAWLAPALVLLEYLGVALTMLFGDRRTNEREE